MLKNTLFILLLYSLTFAQEGLRAIGADTVIAFSPGSGQNAGQTAPYFPDNVLGLPDTTARWKVPASNANQICCLGLGGSITLGFFEHPIVDKPGNDFTVFENAFLLYTGKIFCEPGKVEISKDNITYFQFPFDTLTLKGCAGITPTNGENNPADTSVSGGDFFDIGKLGLDTVKYVRITDVSKMVLNNPQHPFYNFSISGFDLDAIVAINYAENTTSVKGDGSTSPTDYIVMQNYPNPFNPTTTINYTIPTKITGRATITIYNLLGKELETLVNENVVEGSYQVKWNANGLSSGIYLARLNVAGHSKTIKMNLIK